MPSQYENVQSIRNNLINALLQDSLNPTPSYSVGVRASAEANGVKVSTGRSRR